MKILFWLNTFLPDLGGIQTFTSDLLPYLRRQGHEIALIADHGNENRPSFSVHSDVPVYCFDKIRPMLKQDAAGILRTSMAIKKLVREFQPDLIHLHPCGPEIFYYQQVIKANPLPTLLTIHNNYETENVRPTLDNEFGKLLSIADEIATVSDNVLNWILSYRPEFEAKSRTILNGISEQPASVKALPWNPPVILSLGRLVPQKQIDVLLRAFQLVLRNKPDARLKVVGDGEDEVRLKTLVIDLKISSEVEFLGRVGSERVPELLNQSTLFAMSSMHEGLPIAALEAAQMARPIVSTRAGGMDQVVLHGETGLLVETGDVTGLAGAMCKLLDDCSLAAQFGSAGKKHVSTQFGMLECARKYNEAYKRIATSEDL